jgi:hypothetical protein
MYYLNLIITPGRLMVITDAITIYLRYTYNSYLDLGYFFAEGITNFIAQVYYIIYGEPSSL